jgi:hypothetical protein
MKKELSKKERHDLRTLASFVNVYCSQQHVESRSPFEFTIPGEEDIVPKNVDLCMACTKLLKYALSMRLRCPLDPKPMCKKCPDPCYRTEYREKIREVMKFSGMHLLKRGRIDLIYHYFR